MKKIIIVMFLIGLVLLTSGCTALDPCKRHLEECNYDCGEGILSGICKEKCTFEYNKCKEISG